MRPVVLYRGEEFVRDELLAATKAGFYCTDSRMDIKAGDVVVGRYSCLPFYREQERDLQRVGAKLINTYAEHSYIADLGQWYQDLKHVTPTTWTRIIDIPDDEPGPFILKGACNSKKFLWTSHCYAKDRKAIGEVMCRLMDDTMIGQQQIFIRKFEPLLTYGHDINGMPITAEFRYFTAYNKILSSGYYWSSHVEDLESFGVDKASAMDSSIVPTEFVEGIMARIGEKTDCYPPGVVIDVGIKQDGQPILIEINDLQMSGLSENDPNLMYKNLYTAMVVNEE